MLVGMMLLAILMSRVCWTFLIPDMWLLVERDVALIRRGSFRIARGSCECLYIILDIVFSMKSEWKALAAGVHAVRPLKEMVFFLISKGLGESFLCVPKVLRVSVKSFSHLCRRCSFTIFLWWNNLCYSWVCVII